MNKIRQFSFQDYIVSRQSEGGLDSLSSHFSSCDTQNSNRQYQGFPPPSSRNDIESERNPVYSSPAISNPLSNKQIEVDSQNKQGANIQNINSQNELERVTSHAQDYPQSSFDKENNNFHFEQSLANQQNSEIQQKNQENWERMDKINRMLEEHRRKKTASVTRSPLGKIDDDSDLQEEEKPYENIIKLYPVQNVPHSYNESEKHSDEEMSAPKQSQQTEDDYRVSHEAQEHNFSPPAMNEPYIPTVPVSVFPSQLYQAPFEKHNHEVDEIRSLAAQKSKSVKSLADYSRQMEASVSKKSLRPSINKESKRTTEKNLPIEERLRIKNVEKENKMAQMRAERTKENMKELQTKPHISENSRLIAKNSRRAQETAEVIERLLSPDAKRGKIFANPRDHNIPVSHSRASQDRESSQLDDRNDPNKSLYRKKEKEPSISLSKHNNRAFETFNPPETGKYDNHLHEIDELHHEYQQSNPVDENDTIGTLHPSSSTTSLQKEVSDRLALALAKKKSSKANLLEIQPPHNNQSLPATTEHNLYGAIAGALSPHGNGQKGRTLSNQNKGFRLAPELVDTPIPGSGQESIAMRTPKHIYLKVSHKFGHEKPSTNSLLSQSKTEVTSESLRNQFGHLTSVHNAESTIEEYEKDPAPELHHPNETEHDLTNESIQTENRKRSVRQPTFGVSNSHMFTNMSSKKSSFGNSPHKPDIRVLEPRKENRYSENMEENHPLSKISKMMGSPTHESLLNSWKLRQQIFSNTREHKLSIATSSSGQTFRLGDENQTPKTSIMMDKENYASPETNVYLRNAMWLSAKNNKLAVQQVNKERQEMQECTFHPQLDEKTYMVGLVSPKRDCKTRLAAPFQERKDSNRGMGHKNNVSYRDLRAHYKGKHPEHQNQTIAIRTSSKAEALLNADQDDSEEPKISVELREDGQKYYLL